MWGALKKDFGEFVSTVATDATDVLQTLDSNLDGDGTAVESVGLFDPDTGMPIEYDAEEAAASVFAAKAKATLPPKPGDASIEEMKAFLVTCDAVFADVIDMEDDPETAQFIDSFDIANNTEEISKLLETNQQLEQTFSRLVDRVEYADFWKRYFYRLDDERVEATYQHYYQLHVKALAANDPKARATTALSNVTSFLGGVVHRLVEENDVNDTADDDEEIVNDDDNTSGAFGSSAVNFLAGSVSGARPPFVMNTAVSDDDDGDDNEDEEEYDDDEEELGWDDDDEDDVSEDGEEDQNETVEFKDAEKEKLQEELAQAREERDMLHKTVEMQAEEIKKLKEVTQPAVVAGGDESSQIQRLQMQLFEKDSELAALRAQLDDMKNDEEDDGRFESEASVSAAKMAKEVDQLKELIASKDREIANLKASDEAAEKFEAEAAENAAKAASEIDRLREEIVAKEREIAELKALDRAEQMYEAEASADAAEAARELDRLKEEITSKDAQLADLQASLTKETSELRSELDQALAEKDQVQSTLLSQIDDLRQSQEQSAGNANLELESIVAQKDTEIADLKASLESAVEAIQAQGSLEQQLSAAQEESVKAKADASQALDIATSVRTELAKSHSRIEVLKLELERTKATLAEREVELHNAKRPSSPGSSSTGVKVPTDNLSQDEPPLPKSEPLVAKLNAGGGDDDDGWGDDW